MRSLGWTTEMIHLFPARGKAAFLPKKKNKLIFTYPCTHTVKPYDIQL